MNTRKLFIFILCSTLGQNVVLANSQASYEEEYTEITYEQLLNDIRTKKKNIVEQKHSPFDEVKIHSGMGYINSFTQLQINNKVTQRYQNGLQLMLGIDLFSNEWYSEGVFRNFGVTSNGSENLTLKELDFRIGYKNSVDKTWSYKIAGGLSNRLLQIIDSEKGIDINDITPSAMGALGLSMKISPRLFFTMETSGRSTLVSRTSDLSSVDFTFQIQAEL